MMLYLTGASVSLAKSSEAPQTDVSKSLGGYISSSPVPNGSVNALFDVISMHTLKSKASEIIALGLVNKFDSAVYNVEVRVITSKDNVGKFKIAAVGVGSDYLMEHIENRYSEPIQAEFHDIDFYRASVDAEIKQPASVGEIISFQPFDVTVEVTKPEMAGTMEAIINAFANSEYQAIQISNNRFRICSRGDEELSEPWDCTALATENANIEFDGKYENGKTNKALLTEELNPNEAIGLWIKRDVDSSRISNEEIIQRFNEGYVKFEREDIELAISYDTERNEEPGEDDNPTEEEPIDNPTDDENSEVINNDDL